MNQHRFERNLDAMCALLDSHTAPGKPRTVGLELERFLVSADGRTVPYEGGHGVSALLGALARGRDPESLAMVDGRLMGFSCTVETAVGPVPLALSLEPAAQIEVSVGPAYSPEALYEAMRVLDREVEGALRKCGIDARLVARGYNPVIESPTELALIPKERYRNMDAHLSRQGRFARDMMRGTASTQVSLDYRDEADAVSMVRAAEVLGPVLAFLFDNAPVFRGEPSPGMARSRIWRETDPERCGTLPGSLEDGYSLRAYAEWVANVRPILFTDRNGRTVATGDRTARSIMEERDLDPKEVAHLLSMVFPNVRLKGFLEYREMDALPPRLAAACTGLVAAAIYHRDELPSDVLDLGMVTEDSLEAARRDLEERGWEARPYGVAVDNVVAALLDIAEAHAATPFDRKSVDLLHSLWDAHRLPRDLDETEFGELA